MAQTLSNTPMDTNPLQRTPPSLSRRTSFLKPIPLGEPLLPSIKTTNVFQPPFILWQDTHTLLGNCVFGYIAMADGKGDAASVGVAVLQSNEQDIQNQLSQLRAGSDTASTSSPATLIVAHGTSDGSPLRKVSVLIGKYA